MLPENCPLQCHDWHLLISGVETFQRMMRESKAKSAGQKRSSLAEETGMLRLSDNLLSD